MKQFTFSCLRPEAAEENFRVIEGFLSGFAQVCERFNEPTRSTVLAAFAGSIDRDYRVYMDDGESVVSFVNAHWSLIIRSIRSKISLAQQFKEECA